MAKNFSVALSLLLNSSQYTQGVARVATATEGMKNKLESIGKSIKSVIGLGLAAMGAAGAFDLFKKAMNSTDISGDKFEMAMQQAEAATGAFYRTLTNGDWGDFLSNMGKAIKAGKEYAEAMDFIENKTRGNSISNAEDEKRISEIRLELVKAKAKGMAGKAEADKLIQEALAIRQNELTRNVALGAKKYSAEVNKVTARGVDEKTLVDWTRYTKSSEYNEEGVGQYQELLKRKKNINTDVVMQQDGLGGFKMSDNTAAVAELKRVNSAIDGLLVKYPELIKYNTLLSNVSGDEIKKIADTYIEKIQAETDINKGNLKLTKQSMAIDLMGDKADVKAQKDQEAIKNKTGLLNELNEKIRVFTELQGRATTDEGFISYGRAIEAVKGQVSDLNAELEKTIKNDDRLLKPKFTPLGTPALSNSLIPTGIIKPTQSDLDDANKAGGDMGQSFSDGISSMTAQAGSMFGEAMASIFKGGAASEAFSSFSNGILQMIGQFLVSIGTALIAYGVAIGAFKTAFSGPQGAVLAIAAGATAVVVGGVLSGLASAGPKGSASMSGGSSYSGGGNSYSSPSTQAQEINLTGEFILKGNNLVASIANTNRKNLNTH